MKKASAFLLLLAVGTAFFTDAANVNSKQEIDLVEEDVVTRRTKALLGMVEEASNMGIVEAIKSKGTEAGGATVAGRDLVYHDDYDGGDYGDNDNGYDNDGGDYGDNGYDNDGNYGDNDDGDYGGSNGYNNGGDYGDNNGYDNGGDYGGNNGYDNGDYGDNDAYGNGGDYGDNNNDYHNGYDNDGYGSGHGYGNPYGDSHYGIDADCDFDRDYYNKGDGDYGSVTPYDISDYQNKVGPYSSDGYGGGGDGYGDHDGYYSDMYDYDCRCPCEGSADVEYGVQVDVYDIFYGNPLPHAPCDLPVDTICVSDFRAMELIIDSPVIFQCRRFGYCLHHV